MARATRIAAVVLAGSLAVACGNGATPHVDGSFLSPQTLEELADAGPLRVEGTVRSDVVLHEVPAEPRQGWFDGPTPPSGFSYEIVEVEIDRILGPHREEISAGDVLSVGVGVVTPPDASVVNGEGGVVPGETFPPGARSRGVFFLSRRRPLGTFGDGYEVMGWADFGSAPDRDSAVLRGMPGELAGRTVEKGRVFGAAERPPVR